MLLNAFHTRYGLGSIEHIRQYTSRLAHKKTAGYPPAVFYSFMVLLLCQSSAELPQGIYADGFADKIVHDRQPGRFPEIFRIYGR